MTYITGDTHGDFSRYNSYDRYGIGEGDTVVVLGDAGLNYYENNSDKKKKKFASSFPFTTFCIHGNHEKRPFDIPTYLEKEFNGGIVYYEPEFPNILFAKDGEVYDFDGHKCIVIGGAYSVDKEYRLLRGYKWFYNEQPSEEIKEHVEAQLDKLNYSVDVVFSHTCPIDYEPIEMFLSGIDQRKVDSSTEEWLGEIEKKLNYKKWYCGHWHTSKKVDKLQFVFEDTVMLNDAVEDYSE